MSTIIYSLFGIAITTSLCFYCYALGRRDAYRDALNDLKSRQSDKEG